MTDYADRLAAPAPADVSPAVRETATVSMASARAGQWTLLCLALVAVVYTGTLLILPHDGFWVVDNGNKFLQVVAALKSGYASLTLPWPGRALDPSLRFNPIAAPFAIVQNGQIYSQYPPVFALVSSVPFRCFGYVGLYLLPLLASLATLPALLRLGGRLGMVEWERAVAVLLAAVGTPLWFYSVNFWEHTLAICAITWALDFFLAYLAERRTCDIVLSAVLTALAIYFRDELYLLLPLLLCALLWQCRKGRLRSAAVFTAVLVVSLVPLWLINSHYTGHPTGFHATANLQSSGGLSAHLRERGEAFFCLFAANHRNRALAWFLALPYLTLFFTRPRLPRTAYLWAVPGCCLAASVSLAVTLWGYSGDPRGPLHYLIRANGLFSAAPFLILAFLRDRDSEAGNPVEAARRQLLWLLILSYAGIYWLAAPLFSTSGAHWGNRFLLVLYPWMALLAAGTLLHWLRVRPHGQQLFLAPAGLAVALSVGAQFFSIHLLYRAEEFSSRFNHVVAAMPEQVIVTDHPLVAQQLHQLFYDRQIFLVHNSGEVQVLAPLLERAGTRHLLTIRSMGPHPRETPGSVLVRDDGLEYYHRVLERSALR